MTGVLHKLKKYILFFADSFKTMNKIFHSLAVSKSIISLFELVQWHHSTSIPQWYRQNSNISRTLVGNKIVGHSLVVGASPYHIERTSPVLQIRTYLACMHQYMNNSPRWNRIHIQQYIENKCNSSLGRAVLRRPHRCRFHRAVSLLDAIIHVYA